uniref:Uncharacterized protein n=1 Tax=Mycena chlorophos TaxID=658473 RepID=A0ABQ0KZ86_MYCCL|nr:predicted protein [Mycena chlorophos]
MSARAEVAAELNASDVRKTLLPSRMSMTAALPRTSTLAGSTRCRSVGRLAAPEYASDVVRGADGLMGRLNLTGCGRSISEQATMPFDFIIPTYDTLAFSRLCQLPRTTPQVLVITTLPPSRSLYRSPAPFAVSPR